MSRYKFRSKRPIADRFWPKVEKTDGCWLWRGALDGKGYGVIGVGGKNEGIARAHRVSWELAYGSIPEGGMVLHSCDTPACVRPAHLSIGDQSQNMGEAAQRGRTSRGAAHSARTPRGMRHHNARLSDAQVAAIRARRAAGDRLRAIAADFGTSEAHVSRIAREMSRRA